MYLTYDEYYSLGGALDSAAFQKCLIYAEAKLDELTPLAVHPLDKTIPVKRATVFLIDNYAAQRYVEKTPKIASFGNDGVSVSYVQKSAKEEEEDLRGVIHALLPRESCLGARRC